MESFDISKIHNDDQKFLEFMKMYRVDLYKTALAFLKNNEEALEAIQEVTFRAYKKRKHLKNPAFLKTWLIRIMINYCQDTFKKQKRFHLFSQQEGNLQAKDEFKHIWLNEAIEKLNKNEQELIYFKYFHGYTYEELSQYLKIPEGTLKDVTITNKQGEEIKYNSLSMSGVGSEEFQSMKLYSDEPIETTEFILNASVYTPDGKEKTFSIGFEANNKVYIK